MAENRRGECIRAMEDALRALQADVATCQTLENALRGKPATTEPKPRAGKGARKDTAASGTSGREVGDVLTTCIQECTASRKRFREESVATDDLSDEGLSQFTRFTDDIGLDVYKDFLHYAPRLVNVVTVRLLATHRPILHALCGPVF